MFNTCFLLGLARLREFLWKMMRAQLMVSRAHVVHVSEVPGMNINESSDN